MIALGFQLLSVALGLMIGAELTGDPARYTASIFIVALIGLSLILLGKEREDELP